MFFRTKKSGPRTYLQIVENHWRDGRPQQTVIATVGRLDELQGNGQVDALLTSGARFAQKLLILAEHKQGKLPVLRSRRWGAPLVFEKLWHEIGGPAVIREVLRGRHFEFAVERAVFMTVLHRLLAPGSDRAAERWKENYVLEGVDKLELHHLYRAMGFRFDPSGARRWCCEYAVAWVVSLFFWGQAILATSSYPTRGEQVEQFGPALRCVFSLRPGGSRVRPTASRVKPRLRCTRLVL